MSKLSWVIALAAGCSTTANDPQYVDCTMTPTGTPPDLCHVDADPAAMMPAIGTLHIPVKPETADDTALRMKIQATVDPSIVVPNYRVDEYDVSVEWRVTNNDSMPGTFKISLDVANEAAAWDLSAIPPPPPGSEAPLPPHLQGNIPTDIGPNAVMEGVFTETDLLEAAVDLDQISRGNVNMFAATLTVNKNADSFQPVTPYDPVTMTGGTPTGVPVPRSAWRAVTRVQVTLDPDRPMSLDFDVRVRPHRDVIHPMGLSAPAAEIMIYDPPPFVPPAAP